MALLQILHSERPVGATPTPRNPVTANIVVTGRLGKTPSTADGEAHVEEHAGPEEALAEPASGTSYHATTPTKYQTQAGKRWAQGSPPVETLPKSDRGPRG
jgi:hypothetical protein